MAKKGVTYETVAQACDTMLKDGQTITLRAILAHTAGSPNNILKHWQKWQQDQEATTLKNLEEDFSLEIKQALRAEYAHKTQALKAQHSYSMKTVNQQLADLQALLDAKVTEKEDLRLRIATVKSELRDQERKTAVAEQRSSDYAEKLKEVEKNFIQAEKGKERITAEKSMLEKQMADLQTRFTQLEQQYQALQADKQRSDLEIAKLKAKTELKI